MILAFGVPLETEHLSLINLHDIAYSLAILSYASAHGCCRLTLLPGMPYRARAPFRSARDTSFRLLWVVFVRS